MVRKAAPAMLPAMREAASTPALPDGPSRRIGSLDTRTVPDLRTVLERLRMARLGTAELDANLADALEAAFLGAHDFAPGVARFAAGPHCSTDLTDALDLLPRDYNFSLGQRDGVFWAWIQPNDRWQPGEYEARHDHPGGSGLVVAYTAALALACAAILLLLQRADVDAKVFAPGQAVGRDAGLVTATRPTGRASLDGG